MEGIVRLEILKIKESEKRRQEDFLVKEEPLEIRVAFEKGGIHHQKSISVTMRTPGNDEELALGFLFTEGIITGMEQVKSIFPAQVRWREARGNVIVVELAEHLEVNFKRLDRHFYTASSCGVCGKASIEAVFVQGQYELPEVQPLFTLADIYALPQKLLRQQSVFDTTGGVHGAALFDKTGTLLISREDVGRHNALDKLIGSRLKQGLLPMPECLVLVSGRIGFELVQKSIMAGFPAIAAVGAPSNLAVELAQEAGMTLIGFLRSGRFNIYTHPERVIFE